MHPNKLSLSSGKELPNEDGARASCAAFLFLPHLSLHYHGPDKCNHLSLRQLTHGPEHKGDDSPSFKRNSSRFGKLFSVTVDGQVYAQPLYLANVSIAGGTHNVVFLATEHDSLYAIDANVGTVYWHISLIPVGGSTVPSSALACSDIAPEVGITSTPVIDT